MVIRKKNEVIQPARSSIQIWYSSTKDISVGLELDINIWRLKNTRTTVFLDLGLSIDKASGVDSLFLYFPFLFDKHAITDLGKYFENPQILKGIFNEDYVTSNNTGNPKDILVKDDNTNDALFSIYKFDVENDLQVENSYGGTIISFEVKKAAQTENRYYRFRVATKEFSPFIEHNRPKNTFFESAFVETELLDFRINEKRNQDSSLMEKITDSKRFMIKSINFFVMTSIKDDVISDGINLVYKRQLEMGDFWKPYLEINYEKMSVYKSNNVKKNPSGNIDDFSCFAKINYRKSNISTIIKYLFVLLLITIAFTTISNIVWHYIESILWNGGSLIK